jgi:hypothetical protein
MTEEIPQVVEINCETGEQIYRPMNAEELARREADRIEWEAAQAAAVTAAASLAALKTSAKAKLIAGQPLTEEEAAVIVL